MADNRIELVARIDTATSINEINSQDIPKMQDGVKALQIKCTIDQASIKALQNKLGNISGGAINIDSRAANSSLRAIAESSDGATTKVRGLANSLADLESKYSKPIRAVIDNEGFVKAEETMAKLKEQLSSLGTVEVSGVYGDQFGVNKLEKMVATIKSKYGELRTMTFELGDNDLFRFLSGKFDERGVQKQTEEIGKFVDTYITKLNSLKAKLGENFAPNISATVGEDLNKTIVTFDSFENKLLELRNGKGSIEEIRAEFVALDGTVKNLGSLLRGGDSSLNQFTNATNNARNFTNELKALEVEFENLSATTRSDSLFNSLADAQQKLVDLQKTQSTEGYTANWIRQYQELSVAIKQATEDLKLAKKLEQQDATSAARQQAQAIKDIAAAYKEIQQYTKTAYNPSAGRNEVANAESNVVRLREIISLTVQRLKDEGLLSEEVMRQIQVYDNLAVETENILNERRTAVEESKREAQAVSDITKAVKEYGKALSNFNKNRLTTNNASNPQVQAQVSTNSDLLNQLNGLSTSLAGDTSATNIERVRAELDALIPKLEVAAQDSNKLNASLRDSASARAMQANLDGLINRMNIFASTNAKATSSLKQMRSGTSFADEWNRITQALRSGNLDQNAIKQLGIDFRNFKQEADAAGLTTSRFFTNMNSQLRMVLQRWISLYAVIGYIRKMVEEVKALDTAMINLKRVTDETEESYQKFLERANSNASALKTTTSSIVEQSYQWAKLGYSMEEALELANASTIYQRVGDVDQSQALSNLVTSLKAFKLEAKDTMGVVDRLDKLNNEFAVSASGLGQGLERSASAMAMTGNSLDQTLALLTGAGEITQNLENTGRKVAHKKLYRLKS